MASTPDGTLTDFVRRYTSISSVIHSLKNRSIALLDPQSWDDRNDRYFMQLYKEHRGVGGLYGLCAAQAAETYHHWKVFTGNADGACLILRRDPLETSLADLEHVRFQPVKYLKLDEVRDLTAKNVRRLPFVKRWSFRDEKEYRVIAETSESQQPSLPIEIELGWIDRIQLNPWLPEPLFDSVREVLLSIPGCSRLLVQRSHIIDSAAWKRAGNVIAGKPPPTRIRLKRK